MAWHVECHRSLGSPVAQKNSSTLASRLGLSTALHSTTTTALQSLLKPSLLPTTVDV